MMNSEIGLMSVSAASTVLGAALLCLATRPTARRLARSLARSLAGTLAVAGGCALAVAARGWGVGLTSFVAVLVLATTALALAAPVWPRPTRGAVGLVVAGLLAHSLGAG